MKNCIEPKKTTNMEILMLCSVSLLAIFVPAYSVSTEKDSSVGEVQGTGNILNSDSCYPNPCRNGGTCTIGVFGFGYRCSCRDGYIGDNCGGISFCSSHPCQNGGTCHESSFDYTCFCRTDFYGLNCEYRMNSVNPLHIALPLMGILFVISCVSVIYYRRRRRVLAHIILTEDTSRPTTTHPPPPPSNVYTMPPPPVDPPPAYQPQTYGAYNNPPVPPTYGAYDKPPVPQTYGAYDNPTGPTYPGNHQMPPYSNQPMTQYPKY